MRRTSTCTAVILLLAGFLLGGFVLGVTATPASAEHRAGGVTVAVADVSPNTPAVSATPRRLTFKLDLANTTSETQHVVVTADRSDPIGSRQQLERVMAAPRAPSPDQVSPLRASATVDLPPSGMQTVVLRTFTTTDSTLAREHGWVCLCVDAIYPFWFTATYHGAATSGTASAQTYVPAFVSRPVRSSVSWVWPLLDRPHRLLQARVFTDDALATELGPQGRLTNLLTVIERVASTVPLTIMTDPDLIDSIAQMSTGYRVATANGLIPGTGAADAQAWLTRLRAVLDSHPQLQLEFTPFADPAVDSLSRAGVGWPTHVDTAVSRRIAEAIGRTPGPARLVWPVDRRVARSTLATLVGHGAKSVIVADRTLTAGTAQADPQSALAPVHTANGPATLAVTSGTVQQLAGQVLGGSGPALGLLPELVSELAVQVVQNTSSDSTASPYVLITPPRNLDVDVDVAVRTLEATASTVWSRPLTVEDALADSTVARVDRGTVRIGVEGPSIDPHLLSTLQQVSQALPQLAQLYHDPALGAAFVAPFPTAIARCRSSSLLARPALAGSLGAHLARVVTTTRQSVSIVPPSDKRHRYTLTSKNSKLPVTVVNKLNADVQLRISVTTRGGVLGLTAGALHKKYVIAANSREQLRIPIHVDRVGTFTVVVRLRTTGPNPMVLGSPTALSVRSTALGRIGVIITVVAAVVLALAVLVRAVRRFRRQPPPGAPATPEPAQAQA